MREAAFAKDDSLSPVRSVLIKSLPEADHLRHRGIGLGTQRRTSEFAQRILDRAQALGMGKALLATKTGISRQTLDNLLGLSEHADGAMASIRTFLLLGQALRVHPSWLIEGLFRNVAVDFRLGVQMHANRLPVVEDLNFAEGVVAAPGTHLVKRWRVHNPGPEPWVGLKLVCQDIHPSISSRLSGEALHATDGLKPDAAELELPDIPPGQGLDIAMGFTAPVTSGAVVSRWLAVDSDGAELKPNGFGLWLIVHVTTLADTIAFEPLPTDANEWPATDHRKLSRNSATASSDTASPAALSTFADRVLARATELGFNKKELASRAGLSRQTLDNALRLGRSSAAALPNVHTLLTLAVALKAHPFWLVEGLMADVRLSMHLRALAIGDRVGLVEDISAPDGCVVAPGAHFYKAQTGHKLGNVTWHNKKLVCWDAHIEIQAVNFQGQNIPVQRLISDVQEVQLGQLEGDTVFSASIGFTAPSTPGWAFSYWMLANEDGTPAFNESVAIWVLVYVEPDAAKRAYWPAALTSDALPREALAGCFR